MKIRLGFVSNSSTSSFCIHGIGLDDDVGVDHILRAKEICPDNFKKLLDTYASYKGEYYKNLYNNLRTIDTDEGRASFEKILCDDKDDVVNILSEIIDMEMHYYYEYLYLGRSWKKIKDDKTGGDFKSNISDIIRSVFPDKKCSTYEEAWRDG